VEPDGTQDGLPVAGQPSAPASHPPTEVGQPVERVVGHGLTDQRPERLDRLQLRGVRRQEVEPHVGQVVIGGSITTTDTGRETDVKVAIRQKQTVIVSDKNPIRD
jgi:hypothetical protein